MNDKAKEMFEAIRENELEIAQINFEASLKQALLEDDIEGLVEFAERLHQAGFLSEAKQTYELLKNMAPHIEEWDLFLAELAIDQDHVLEGIDLLLKIDSTNELYPNALLLLADAYQTIGLYEVSEQKILEAISILPEEPILQYALAKLYYAIGSFKKAIPIYENLIELQPDFVEAENILMQLAECYHAIGDFEEGVYYLEQIESKKHTSDSLFQLGLGYLQLKDYGRAVRNFEELLSKDPDYLSAYLYLSQALEADLQLEEALGTILKGIQENPFQAEFYLAAANLHRKLKQPEQAHLLLEKALELEPDIMEAVAMKVDLAMEAEQYEDVISILESQEDYMNQPLYQWSLARAYNYLEEYERASDYFDKAYYQLDENLDFLQDYSQFLREEGRVEDRAEIIKKALSIEPNNPYFLEMDKNQFE
ncbi:Lipopolysaccharide assembly protein B [Jeotgalibaca dankookensis]|uniref:Lipopolysaccharide assembly protein B n=1 Tax=Jeotgalibaca dankookensis TaxID=708126 RepID=A0A1S6IND3_9LACT|nr:tetratricopeptide repeat protein [Jeotgalibaca dankookensis]AQS53052.1 Lipopolysaccharide assembly protein B [Jeotgalibaca dankookensis]